VRDNCLAGLAANSVLIRRHGGEAAIEDSAAPIHDRGGRIKGAVMVFRDVSVARATSLRMAHFAQHDALTDLPNRLLFHDRVLQAMTSARRHEKMLSILFVDLDKFKYINDSLGHAIGDQVLQAVALRLLSCVRKSDTVSRRGGDEFVILLSELSQGPDADVCSAKILSAIGEPCFINHNALYLTASIGVATYPKDGADLETLLKHADAAMYEAKQERRGSYPLVMQTLPALSHTGVGSGRLI
jgi:diguanylate cyclase (GGDEF)-like protein